MIFTTSPFAQMVLSSYSTLWDSSPRTESELQLLQPEHQTALRFYDYIRLRNGEKIPALDLVAIGIGIDELFVLFNLITLKQPGAISMWTNEEILILSYNGQQLNS